MPKYSHKKTIKIGGENKRKSDTSFVFILSELKTHSCAFLSCGDCPFNISSKETCGFVELENLVKSMRGV